METIVANPAEPLAPPPRLLPGVLLGPASFLWLWILPLVVLGLLNLHGYWLIGSEMNPEQRSRAMLIGMALVANLVVGLGTFYCGKFGRGDAGPDRGHPLWGLPGLLAQIAYLWIALYNLGEGLLPANVTAWIYPEQRFVFNQFTFCMLPAFHGILRLVAARPGASLARTFAFSLGGAIGGPVVLYVVLQAVASLGSSSGHFWAPVFFAILIIGCGAVMFLGVLRALLVALNKAQSWHPTAERWAVVFVALVMPLAGLTLNIEIPFPVDFQATEVYLLTVANAFVVLFAVWTGETRPRLSWFLLCATFPFALYFFIVFLPFTPLSVLAVIAVGTGLLVLTPILLFALHLHLLARAWRQVSDRAARRHLLAGGLVAVLLLPAFFTVRGLADKAALNAALDHLYEPSVPGGDIAFGSNIANLRRAVNSHRDYKEGLYYPILSDYYAWLVFDNLVLPDGKLNEIEKVFFGPRSAQDEMDPFRKSKGARDRGRAADRKRMRPATLPPQTVVVDKLQARTQPLGDSGTEVTVAMELRNTGRIAAEYTTTLPLPAGVFVRGFRLQVGDTLVPGKIFERKTALWVYSMIRDTERRDPGILYYRNPTELELRVFPILDGKPVKVELDLLVPARLQPDQLVPEGGTPAAVLAQIGRRLAPVATQGAAEERVIAGLDNLSLPAVNREPYLHLIVDRSHEHGFKGDFAAIWPALRAKFPEAQQVRITLANYEVTSLSPDVTGVERPPAITARELDRIMPLDGGLALDLALAHAIRLHRDHDLDGARSDAGIPPRPIFVMLSRNAAARTLDLPLTEAWADLVPGLEVVELGADGTFLQHCHENRSTTPLLRAGASVRPLVANRLARFAVHDSKSEIQYWDAARGWQRLEGKIARMTDPDWPLAVDLNLKQQDHDRSPRQSALSRRDLVVASRKSGLLLSSASYIVVENQAQWKMLETSERQKLNQNQALEFVETPAPPAVWAILGFLAWLLVRHWRGLSPRSRLIPLKVERTDLSALV